MFVVTKPTTPGQLTNFFKDFYEELHARGHSHAEIITMSCSRALIRFFGSSRRFDKCYGPGAMQSVKQERGKFARWRKTWNNIIDAQKTLQPVRIALLEGFPATIEMWKQVGLTDAEIKDKVSEFLVARSQSKSA